MLCTYKVVVKAWDYVPSGNERANWLEKYGPTDKEVTVVLTADVRLWILSGATVDTLGAIQTLAYYQKEDVERFARNAARENPCDRVVDCSELLSCIAEKKRAAEESEAAARRAEKEKNEALLAELAGLDLDKVISPEGKYLGPIEGLTDEANNLLSRAVSAEYLYSIGNAVSKQAIEIHKVAEKRREAEKERQEKVAQELSAQHNREAQAWLLSDGASVFPGNIVRGAKENRNVLAAVRAESKQRLVRGIREALPEGEGYLTSYYDEDDDERVPTETAYRIRDALEGAAKDIEATIGLPDVRVEVQEFARLDICPRNGKAIWRAGVLVVAHHPWFDAKKLPTQAVIFEPPPIEDDDDE